MPSVPYSFVRMAGLEMHPLDGEDRTDFLKDKLGSGLCNITKCSTEVCPGGIRITDNAIIPLEERVVDRDYDPVLWWCFVAVGHYRNGILLAPLTARIVSDLLEGGDAAPLTEKERVERVCD